MLAAVLHGPQDLRVEDVPEPTVAAGQVKIQVAACGICGSDLHLFRGAGSKAGAPHPPFVIGHEFAGTIVETGRGVTGLVAGDAVSVRPLVTCRQCPACVGGIPNVCAHFRFYGVSPDLAGGMAQFAVVDAENAHRLPGGLPPAKAALAEPIAVGIHAARRGLEQGGETALVLGAGPIGIAIFLALRASGLRDVFIVEPAESRRAAIQALGAETVLDPSDTDLVPEIRALTGGVGADITFDAAGLPQTFTNAQRVAAPRGRIVIVAGYEQPVTLNPFLTASTEQTVTGAFAYTADDFEAAVALAASLSDTGAWVDTLDIRDVASGFQKLAERQGVKLLVRP